MAVRRGRLQSHLMLICTIGTPQAVDVRYCANPVPPQVGQSARRLRNRLASALCIFLAASRPRRRRMFSAISADVPTRSVARSFRLSRQRFCSLGPWRLRNRYSVGRHARETSLPGDLVSVFETMLASATRVCEASYGARWLRRFIRNNGGAVSCLETGRTRGAESVDNAASERPDLVLMDIQLPVLDGFGATR
jgi:hypothetical protein